MAEQNERRQKELTRRRRASSLKDNRSSKRINVVLLLLLTIIMGGAALWPIYHGDLSHNPHEFATENDILNRNDVNHPAAWGEEDLELMSNKVWDGNAEFSGSIQYDLVLPGIPVAIDGVTTVKVKVKLVSYRLDGHSNGFRVALFPTSCNLIAGESMLGLDDRYLYVSETPMMIGMEEEVEFDVPAGRYCVVFEYINPPDEQGWRATIDAEIEPHWKEPIFFPLALVTLLLSIFAMIGAQKAGQAWKDVAQPEAPEEKSVEEEVLEEANEERGDASEGDEESSVEDEPITVEPTAENESVEEEVLEEEPKQSESAEEEAAEQTQQRDYTDDELRALGWTDQQIEWHRQSQQPQQQQTEYTDEQLAGFGWTPEQIATYRQQQ